MAGCSDQFHTFMNTIRTQALVHTRLAEQRRQILIQFSRNLQLVIRRPAELFQRIAKQQQQFLKRNSRLVESVRRAAAELPKRERQALQRLGEEGWFVDPGMPAIPPQDVEPLFDKYPDEMAEWFCDFFREELDTIESKLIDRYPHRGRFLQQAFEAHREGKYGLSVPVFLAQADGIFEEHSPGKRNLFIGRQRRKAFGEHKPRGSDSEGIYLYPLSLSLPLWRSQRVRTEQGDSFVGLNRHRVLHGESLDYDTEQNSLKAVSLLSYLHWIFGMKGESDDNNQ